MPTEEEFQALEVRVREQDKLIKKLTDFLTYQEGSTHETLDARLAGAMNEITVRGEESKEKFLAETKINTSIEQINTEILDIKKLDHIDKQNIDKQHHRINDIEENKIKELEVKIGAIEEKIKESTEAAGQQMPGGASDGTGEPQSGHAGQGDNGEEVKELKEHLGRLQQTVESTALDHADSLARLNAEVQDVKSDQEQKRKEDYSWLKWELGETMKSANTGKGDAARDRSSGLLNPKEATINKLEESASQADFKRWVEELYLHLETSGWTGVTELLKRVRTEEKSIADMPDTIIKEVHRSTSGNFNKTKAEVQAMDVELHGYLIRKLNNKLKGLVDGVKSGFEVFRLIMQEIEPITKSTKGGLLMQFMAKNKTKCANLEASRNLVKDLDKCITEYREKTGEESAGDIQATILHKQWTKKLRS